MKEHLISQCITVIILCFFGGFMCFLAWNGFAWEFNLPKFSFLHWVVTYTAIRAIRGNMKKEKD